MTDPRATGEPAAAEATAEATPSHEAARAPTIPVSPPAPAPACGSPTLWLPPPPHLGAGSGTSGPGDAGDHRDPEDVGHAAPTPHFEHPRLTPLTAAAIAGVVILFLGLAWVLITHLPSPAGGPTATPTASPTPTPPGFSAAERACIESTEDRNRALFDKAAVTWKDSSLPLDFEGNPAYRDYADAVTSLDLRACPRRYTDAYATWVGVWRGYGTYLQDMSKPHLPWDDQWSDEAVSTKRAEYEAGVRGAYSAIRNTARSGGVHLPHQDWTPHV